MVRVECVRPGMELHGLEPTQERLEERNNIYLILDKRLVYTSLAWIMIVSKIYKS